MPSWGATKNGGLLSGAGPSQVPSCLQRTRRQAVFAEGSSSRVPGVTLRLQVHPVSRVQLVTSPSVSGAPVLVLSCLWNSVVQVSHGDRSLTSTAYASQVLSCAQHWGPCRLERVPGDGDQRSQMMGLREKDKVNRKSFHRSWSLTRAVGRLPGRSDIPWDLERDRHWVGEAGGGGGACRTVGWGRGGRWRVAEPASQGLGWDRAARGMARPQDLAGAWCSFMLFTARRWEPTACFHQGRDWENFKVAPVPLWGEVAKGAGGCAPLGGLCNVLLGSLARWMLLEARMPSLTRPRVCSHACVCVPSEGCPRAIWCPSISLVPASAQVQVLWTPSCSFNVTNTRGVSLSIQLV